MTNSPPMNYHKTLNPAPLPHPPHPHFVPPLKFQKKFPPTNMSRLKPWSRPSPSHFTKGGGTMRIQAYQLTTNPPEIAGTR